MAELPAAAPVSVPAPATVPRTPDGAWSVRESGPRGGGPRRGYSPMDGILEVSVEVSVATGETGKYELRSEGDPGTDGRLPPPGLKLCLF